MRGIAVVGLAALAASAARAEVKSVAADGFELESRAVVRASPADVFRALGEVQRWWDPAHSYSGKAENLRLAPKAGGCFCETIPADGGSIEHARVVYSRPNATLRLQGGLGPLQAEAALGTLTWELKAVEGGTEITQTYVVGGNLRGRGRSYAPAVDEVLGTQLSRLQAYLDRSR